MARYVVAIPILEAVSTLLLDSNEDKVDRAINRLIADGDDRALLDLLAALPSTVKGLREDPGERFDAPIAIINGCAIAAVALRRGKLGIVESALDALLTTYRLGDVERDGASEEDIGLWEETAACLWALGAVAVHTEQWDTVRSIAVRVPVDGGHYKSWLRHAQVMSARGVIDPADDNILNLCVRRLSTNPSFGLVGVSAVERERLVSGFDQLAHLIVMAQPDAGVLSFYPSYSKYPVAHVEPFIIALRRYDDMREAIYPGSDDDLRAALSEVNEMALFQAAQHRYGGGTWAYEGFQDARTWAFIREGYVYEQWANLTAR